MPFLKLNKIDQTFQELEMKISLDLKILLGIPWQVPECCWADVLSMDSKGIPAAALQSYVGYLLFIEESKGTSRMWCTAAAMLHVILKNI